MTRMIVFAVVQAFVLQQGPISTERTLDAMNRNGAAPQRMQKLPGDTRLDRMYNAICDRTNEINFSDSSEAEKFEAMKEYRAETVPAADLEYVVETCQLALHSGPPEWETVRRCLVVAEIGMRDARFGSMAASIVSFDGFDTENVGVDQIRTMMVALTTIARFSFPDATDIIRRCADGSMWDGKTVTSSARPDLVRLLQGRAILCLATLPYDTAEPLVEELERMYPPDLVAEGGDDARLALFLTFAREDLERQRKGEPPLVVGIR